MNEQIKRVFEKISNDDNLSEQLVKINDVNELADFLISLGCKISKEELVQDLVNMCKKALHDEALSNIAGGKMINKNFSKAISASLAAISLINPISAATDPLSPKVDEPLVRTQANNSSGDSQSPKSKSKKGQPKNKKTKRNVLIGSGVGALALGSFLCYKNRYRIRNAYEEYKAGVWLREVIDTKNYGAVYEPWNGKPLYVAIALADDRAVEQILEDRTNPIIQEQLNEQRQYRDGTPSGVNLLVSETLRTLEWDFSESGCAKVENILNLLKGAGVDITQVAIDLDGHMGLLCGGLLVWHHDCVCKMLQPFLRCGYQLTAGDIDYLAKKLKETSQEASDWFKRQLQNRYQSILSTLANGGINLNVTAAGDNRKLIELAGDAGITINS